ncbi:melibiose:sodium transporter MelB [Staphylococcus coagulans]|nr:melibiose:sodium transporter MelB [Staphylococcus coagulans]MBT2810189.1 melibiose:sodium transporter MelB [Staphylococcus coagulans]MBT2812044.1 melibiose:sodium transporter MelB [Staphylococcus coagulans]MBT2819887.1 melibiose:sodium transporter MelB [Staphylococcus coagulans]MBT2821630.1 melibiose:sodium transporter MelB [Staphylococcus coagulans]
MPRFCGVSFFIARIWDAINDPLMGMMVDRTQHRFGKFKIWLGIGTTTNALITLLLFTNFELPQFMMYVYVSVMYVLWGMTYTMMDIPYWAWLPNLTQDSREREKMSVIPSFFASLAACMIGTWGLYLIDRLSQILGHGHLSVGMFIVALFCSVLFVVTIGVTLIGVPENQSVKVKLIPRLPFNKIKQMLFHHHALLAMMGLLLFFNLGMQLLNGTLIYYFKYVINIEQYFVYFNSVIFVEMLALVCLPFWIGHVGRQNAFNSAMLFIISGLVLILYSGFVAPHQLGWILFGGMVLRIGTGFMLGMVTIMLADVIDDGEMQFGRRHDSLITATYTFITKASHALSGLMIGAGMSLFHFIPNQHQRFETQMGIRILGLILPILCIVISTFLYHQTYPLKESSKIKRGRISS